MSWTWQTEDYNAIRGLIAPDVTEKHISDAYLGAAASSHRKPSGRFGNDSRLPLSMLTVLRVMPLTLHGWRCCMNAPRRSV